MRSLLAGFAALAVVAGCAAPPASSIEPSASSAAQATGTPTAAPTDVPPSPSNPVTLPPTAGPPSSPDVATRPDPRPDRLATVIADGLAVRLDASFAAPLQMDFVTVKLDAGDHVLVLGEPVWADGTWWVEIGTDEGCQGTQAECTEEPIDGLAGRVVVGWVDGGTVDAPSLATDRSWCPSNFVGLPSFLRLSPIERLGCHGSTSITISAYPALEPDGGLGGACASPGPRWLTCDNINYNWVNRDGSTAWEFLLHFDPRTGVEPTGLVADGPSERLKITGHFDDPAARRCKPVRPTGETEVAEYGELHCRTLFVVEDIR